MDYLPEPRYLPRMDNYATKAALAAKAWRELFHFFVSTRWRHDQVLERHGLTPNDAEVLDTLHPVDGQPMSTLAEAWGTDASNATWVVDRLERKGLAERRADPGDRRVKLVVLTKQGEQTRDAVVRALHTPPPELLTLTRQELATLGELLAQLPQPAPAERGSDGS